MNVESKFAIEAAVRFIGVSLDLPTDDQKAARLTTAMNHISNLLKVIEDQQAELDKANAAMEATGAGTREEMAWCAHCNFPTIHYDDICSKCGHPLFETRGY